MQCVRIGVERPRRVTVSTRSPPTQPPGYRCLALGRAAPAGIGVLGWWWVRVVRRRRTPPGFGWAYAFGPLSLPPPSAARRRQWRNVDEWGAWVRLHACPGGRLGFRPGRRRARPHREAWDVAASGGRRSPRL